MGIISLVGATGGAGTTRIAVETAGRMAASGDDVLLVDVDFATQGLAEYVPGGLETDLVGAICEKRSLTEATYPLETEQTPQPQAAPSYAGLSRVATAMQPDRAEFLSDELSASGDSFDHVVIDTPTPVTNPAIAAATVADTIGVVFPPSPRGIEGLHRTDGFLHDIDAGGAIYISNEGIQTPSVEDPADVSIPELETVPPRAAPTTIDGATGAYAIDTLIEAVTAQPVTE